MKIEKMTFGEFEGIDIEGIVILGAGGELSEWVNGIAEILNDENIANSKRPEDLFKQVIHLTTTGGRNDLALEINSDNVNYGKLAIWRLMFGDCSWISDYKVNYKDHHYE